MQTMFIKFLQAICTVKNISHMALYWFHVLSEQFLAIEHLLQFDCKLFEADIISFVCVFIFLQEHGVTGWLLVPWGLTTRSFILPLLLVYYVL